MYWCKRNSILALSLLLITACKPEIKDNGTAKYFDLKQYFTNEAARMEKLHSAVFKTVNYNNKPEQKRVLIKNWKRELGLFAESDINKPAWKDSYKVSTQNDSTLYTAIDTNLRTRSVLIVMQAKQVKLIAISNFTKNLLYQTKDVLAYYPDSLYLIEKHQSVKILGSNNYLISGKLR